ncbi:hypothetical protein KJA16_00625 [Patescibacteria group bacterium]|nr:hypothetical protein [Patescibacteria group bacterium]
MRIPKKRYHYPKKIFLIISVLIFLLGGSIGQSSSCADDCPFIGKTQCYNRTYRLVCDDYDYDSCLEWSSPQLCSGSTSYGYGFCSANQRPKWYCSYSKQKCFYSCQADLGSVSYHDYLGCYNNDVYWFDYILGRQEKYQDCFSNQICRNGQCVGSCECYSGPCCDGCHYKSYPAICDTESQTQYSCPWSSVCGADVGRRIRTRFRYCSGNSSQCSGRWSDWTPWTRWLVSDDCSSKEVCVVGYSQCQYSSECAQPQTTYIKHYIKNCYDNDLYWFDSKGIRQDKYQDCSDDNECTIDGCQDGKCFNELKCDETTCQVGSTDYCENCNHCGDDICNCEENNCTCSRDCGLIISILGKTETTPTEWKEEFDIKPEEKSDFLIVVVNNSPEILNNVIVKAEIPQEIIYKGELKIDGVPYTGDIRDGIDTGSLSSNTIKTITFRGEMSPNELIDIEKTETEISGNVNVENLSVSDSVKITLERSGMWAKESGTWVATIGLMLKSLLKMWYLWLLLGLVLTLFSKKFYPPLRSWLSKKRLERKMKKAKRETKAETLSAT